MAKRMLLFGPAGAQAAFSETRLSSSQAAPLLLEVEVPTVRLEMPCVPEGWSPYIMHSAALDCSALYILRKTGKSGRRYLQTKSVL